VERRNRGGGKNPKKKKNSAEIDRRDGPGNGMTYSQMVGHQGWKGRLGGKGLPRKERAGKSLGNAISGK